jgi:hypothetical protein
VAVDEPDEAIEKPCPIPVSETVCGLPLALSVTVNVPFIVPPCVGSKKTPIEQLTPGATLLLHPLTAPKLGLAATLEIATVKVPLLVSVTVWGRPDVPTYWVGNVRDDGDKRMDGPGPPNPVPLRLTVCPPSESVTAIWPVTTPFCVGEKVTVIVQL